MKDSVRGTATAASLWITGAIGIAVGLGSYDVAVPLAAATVITLWLLSPLKKSGAIAEAKVQEGSEADQDLAPSASTN
jgi:putative Mg2+ transporter-C (MgtC) family protein